MCGIRKGLIVSTETVKKLVRYIETKDFAWDAVLKLKLVSFHSFLDSSQEDPHTLINYLSHQNWMIRWTVIEKLIAYDNPKFYFYIIQQVDDPRIEISHMISDWARMKGVDILTDLIQGFVLGSYSTQKSLFHYINQIGYSALNELELQLNHSNLTMVQRCMYAIYKIGGSESERIMIRALGQERTQKHAVVFWGLMKSRAAISHLITAFENPKLRYYILNTFYDIGEEASYPFIVETIYEAKGQLLIMAERIAMKIGPPILDYVLDFIEQSDTELENHFRFKKLLDHIGIDSVQDRMDAQSDRYSFLYS